MKDQALNLMARQVKTTPIEFLPMVEVDPCIDDLHVKVFLIYSSVKDFLHKMDTL